MGALLYVNVKDMLKYRYYLEDIKKSITFVTEKQKNILLTIKNIYIMKTKFTFATTSATHTVSVIKEVKETDTVAEIIILLTPEESAKIILEAKIAGRTENKRKISYHILKENRR
jgi:hypothetical protein